MARAGSYFAQAVSAPAVRAALSKAARCYGVAEFVHLVTTYHHPAADPELHDWLGAIERPGAQRIARGSVAGDPYLNDESLRDLSLLSLGGTRLFLTSRPATWCGDEIWRGR